MSKSPHPPIHDTDPRTSKYQFFVGHTRFDQWSMGVICLLVVPFFFLPLYIGWGPWAIMLYFYLGLSLILSYLIHLFLQTFHNLYLYREGIEIHKPFQAPQFLFWDEIAQVRGSVWHSNLTIANRDGTISCRVNSSYSHPDVLLHLLLWARSDLFETSHLLTLTISPIPVIFLAIIVVQLVLIGLHGIYTGSTGMALLVILVLCLIIFVGAMMVIPYSLSILGKQIVFGYPFRKKVLDAMDVVSINKTTRFDFIYEWGEVTIQEKNGNVILLMFYNLGVSLLYAFLTSWQQMAARPSLTAGNRLEVMSLRGHHRLSVDAPYLLPEKFDRI